MKLKVSTIFQLQRAVEILADIKAEAVSAAAGSQPASVFNTVPAKLAMARNMMAFQSALQAPNDVIQNYRANLTGADGAPKGPQEAAELQKAIAQVNGDEVEVPGVQLVAESDLALGNVTGAQAMWALGIVDAHLVARAKS